MAKTRSEELEEMYDQTRRYGSASSYLREVAAKVEAALTQHRAILANAVATIQQYSGKLPVFQNLSQDLQRARKDKSFSEGEIVKLEALLTKLRSPRE